MRKLGLRYILAYLMWVVVMVLGIWFLIISRNALLGAFGIYGALHVESAVTRAWLARLYDKVYMILAGLLWLALTVVAEAYFREGVQRRKLLRRFCRIAGIELLLIFVADLLLLWLQAWSATWLRWLILGGEWIIGTGCVAFSRLPPPPRPNQTRPGEASASQNSLMASNG